MTMTLGHEKPAAPSKKDGARPKTLYVPCTDQERFRIRVAALKRQMKQSDFLREVILDAVEALENEE